MMKLHRKHLVTGGIALSIALGGGAYGLQNVVFAANTNSVPTVQPSQTDPTAKSQKPDPYKTAHDKGYLRDAAEIIGVTPEELTSTLKSGKSLADAAAEKNMTADALIAKLTEKQSQKIDEAVKNGKLTPENADTAKKKLTAFTKNAVEQKGLTGMGSHPREGKGMYGLKPDQLAGILGITKEQLQSELKAGKSLTEIAQAHNMTKEQLIGKLKEAITPSMERYVDRKGGDKHGQFHEKGGKWQQPHASPSPSPAVQG